MIVTSLGCCYYSGGGGGGGGRGRGATRVPITGVLPTSSELAVLLLKMNVRMACEI